jgi:hypothetical protein
VRIQTITLTYEDDVHLECIIAPQVAVLKQFCEDLGINWQRQVLDDLRDTEVEEKPMFS